MGQRGLKENQKVKKRMSEAQRKKEKERQEDRRKCGVLRWRLERPLPQQSRVI